MQKMEIEIDQDIKAILEFMQSNIRASRLVAVAKRLPELATLLWGHFPQESFIPASLVLPKPSSGEDGL